jgi:signal transduction histidine kinase
MMRWLRRVDPRIFDWLLAIAFTASAIVSAYTTKSLVGPAWLTALLASSSGLAAFIRRSRPLAAIVVWALGIVVLGAWLTPPEKIGGLFFGLLLFPYVVGSQVPARRALVAPVVLAIAVAAVALSSPGPLIAGDLIFPTIFGVLFWLAGRVVRSRTELTAELHEAALVAHEHREAAAARAVAEERRRIAREMHDVVAHSVSTMVIQAGGARRILGRDPARAIEAAALIEQTGRDALKEMRHLLGVLHAGEDVAELAPQPTLQGLDALVARSEAAGLPVRLRIEGNRRELPSGLDLAGYRVVQEALTNALKHGGGSADVLVRFDEDELRVEIADAGRGAGIAPRVEGGGHGLLGMRERVRVFGGELHAGPRAEGGYLVVARLPLQGEEEAALAASTAGRDHTEVLG